MKVDIEARHRIIAYYFYQNIVYQKLIFIIYLIKNFIYLRLALILNIITYLYDIPIAVS